MRFELPFLLYKISCLKSFGSNHPISYTLYLKGFRKSSKSVVRLPLSIFQPLSSIGAGRVSRPVFFLFLNEFFNVKNWHMLDILPFLFLLFFFFENLCWTNTFTSGLFRGFRIKLFTVNDQTTFISNNNRGLSLFTSLFISHCLMVISNLLLININEN